MSASPLATPYLPVDSEELVQAREILRHEAQTLLTLASDLGDDFCQAVDLLANCPGSIIVTGIGKAGLVGQKITASLASTGTRSHFLHPVEAIHGDLGRVHRDDVALVLSASGESEEIVRIIPALQSLGAGLVAITCHPESTLGRAANITLSLGKIREACPHGLAPSASTTAMMALGDALSLVLSQRRKFSPQDFARFHPGGSLGRKLTKVEQVMRPLADCRVATETQTLRAALVSERRQGRRTGAIMVVDNEGTLRGIFTDSDLARLLEAKQDQNIDGPMQNVMTRAPTTVSAGSLLPTACEILASKRISELPVVDQAGRPVGLIDITDIVGIAGESGTPGARDNRTTAAAPPPTLKLVLPPQSLPKR